MTSNQQIRRPLLVPHVRYRWDDVRSQHQIVFPEGMLVLNETGAAIVKLCDGRSTGELVAALQEKYSADSTTAGNSAADVDEFLERLAKKGLLCNAPDDGNTDDGDAPVD